MPCPSSESGARPRLGKTPGARAWRGTSFQHAKPNSISLRWAERCEELTRFAEKNGRMPFAKGHSESESSLGRWLAKQRAAAARGDLHRDKCRALAAAGAWEATPRSQRDARRWEERLGRAGSIRGLREPISVLPPAVFGNRAHPGYMAALPAAAGLKPQANSGPTAVLAGQRSRLEPLE